MTDMTLTHFTRDGLAAPRRWLLAASLAIAAIAHVPVIGPHLDEAPYMGVLFIVLTAACAVLAVAILLRDSRAVYALVVVTCGLAVLGYVATRVVAFPMLADDVGNWLEPLGVVSIISESVAVALALAALVHAAHSRVQQSVVPRHLMLTR
jgi:hypothetical protein